MVLKSLDAFFALKVKQQKACLDKIELNSLAGLLLEWTEQTQKFLPLYKSFTDANTYSALLNEINQIRINNPSEVFAIVTYNDKHFLQVIKELTECATVNVSQSLKK